MTPHTIADPPKRLRLYAQAVQLSERLNCAFSRALNTHNQARRDRIWQALLRADQRACRRWGKNV